MATTLAPSGRTPVGGQQLITDTKTGSVSTSDPTGFTGGSTLTGTSTGGSSTATQTNVLAGLTGDQRNAYTALTALLDQYGLSDLAKTILGYIQQGYDQSTMSYLIQQTDEWKQRFAGNELRKAAGLAELSPAEYLANEAQYEQLFRTAGLSNLATRATYANLIGSNVSPAEAQSRVQVATQFISSKDPSLLQALQQYHGLDLNHLVSYVLDPQASLPQLQQLSNESFIGAEAIRQGLGNDAGIGDRIGRYASMGVSQQQAAQGFSAIADMLPREQQLASIYGQGYDQKTAEQEVFEGLASARRKREQINSAEAAAFSGRGGVGSSVYNPDYGLSNNQSGAY